MLFQTCQRRPGCSMGSKCTLPISWSIGQLQRLQLQRNPLLSFATRILQSKSATHNGRDLLGLNKLMREAKSMPGLCWWIPSVPSPVWLTAADAAWANRPDGSSTGGHVIWRRIRTSCAVSPRLCQCWHGTRATYDES